MTRLDIKCSRSDPGNYRLSLTGIVCKVMESIVRDSVADDWWCCQSAVTVHMSIYQPLTSSHRKRRQQTMNQLRRELLRLELEDRDGQIYLPCSFMHSSALTGFTYCWIFQSISPIINEELVGLLHLQRLASHVSTRLLIHLSAHLYHHHQSHHPSSLLHSFTPGSKPTFSTNPSHLRLLLPTGLPSWQWDWTGPITLII